MAVVRKARTRPLQNSPRGTGKAVRNASRPATPRELKERERCAQLVDVMLDQVPWKEHMMARGALVLAARVIRRGRHLSAAEKMENLRQAIYRGDCDGDD